MRRMRHLLFRLLQKRFLLTNKRHIKRLEKLHLKHQGKPFIYDDENLRFLYFSQTCMQSAMKLNAPDELVFGYTRDMMGFLLSHPAPQHILMIGLGGGSLVKFCYRFLPQSRITVLEISADVLALREQFMIPADDGRLEIIHDDAISYLQKNRVQADVIMLDGFDIDGLVGELNTPDFYASCHRALKPDGIFVANFWGKRNTLVPLVSDLLRQFDRKLWWCRASDCHNLIVFCLKCSDSSFQPVKLNNPPVKDEKWVSQLNELYGRLHSLQSLLDEDETGSDKETELLSTHLKTLMASDAGVPTNYVEWKALVRRQ